MSKNRRPTSDKSGSGLRPLMAMPLKIANKPESGSLVPSDSWLASLAKLAARLSAPPTQNHENQP